MAFLKTANAVLVHPRISNRGWGGIRKQASSGPVKNLTDQAREILGEPLTSDRFLVSHVTIVASVDVEHVPNAKLGTLKVGSQTIRRRWADYYIKPQCSQFVNNNGDSWSREVLRMAYPTFIGAFNFQEHVQIEAQAKGRIIDAVARDIGDSLYVDILVATDKKHTQLVQDILDKKMTTLSMGCTTVHSTCSFCGNVAVDETELCEHIKYQKLNTFMDDAGNKRVIAELCGHPTEKSDPNAPGGVRFIEASWVGVPAFPGAVLRNILSPSEVSEEQVRKVLATAPAQWSDVAVSKAASLSLYDIPTRKAFDFGEDPESPDGGAAPAAEPSEPFKDVEDALYESLKNRVRERIEKEIAKKNVQDSPEPAPAMGPNDSIIKEAHLDNRRKYAASMHALTRVASSPGALVAGVAQINDAFGVQAPQSLYRVALRVGAPTRYSNSGQYLTACRKVAGRALTEAEIRVVVRVGSLLAQWAKYNKPSHR